VEPPLELPPLLLDPPLLPPPLLLDPPLLPLLDPPLDPPPPAAAAAAAAIAPCADTGVGMVTSHVTARADTVNRDHAGRNRFMAGTSTSG
jgi:hypothetical protein